MVEEKFRIRMSPMTLDGKHITMKKPKKSGSDQNNYKGFISLVVLILVSRFRVLLGTMEQSVCGCMWLDGVFVAQHAEDTSGWSRQATKSSK